MNNTYDRCPNCMNPYDGSGNPCPYCGQDVAGYHPTKGSLVPFTMLQNKYMVGRVLGQGGFGITYIGYDINLTTYVAIKEYYPESISVRGQGEDPNLVNAQAGKEEIYNKNLNRFVEEARNLSKFYSLPGIVSVRNFFYENGTAYIVMDFVAGMNLKNYLAQCGGRLDEATILKLMRPVLESLHEIHKQGLIHRDISPDNIMFDQDGSIKLIDFGAVRGQSGDTDMTYTVMLKHGYAPQEQYFSKGKQGPWTDIYSLCATMYKMLTGNVPPNCIERMSQDTYVRPSMCGVSISPNVEAAISKGLSVNIADRYQNIGELIRDLYGDVSAQGVYGAGYVANDISGGYGTGGQTLQPGQRTMGQQAAGEEVSDKKTKSKKAKKVAVIVGSSVAALALVLVGLKFIFKGGDDATTEATTTEATTTEATTEVTSEQPKDADENTLDGTWTDFTFKIDDTAYQLPMTYDEWTSQGWEPVADMTLASGEQIGAKFVSDKMEITASVVNYTGETAPLSKCHIVGIQYIFEEYEIYDAKELILPGNVRINLENCALSSDIDYVNATYGVPQAEYRGDYVSYLQYVHMDYSNGYFRFDDNDVLYYMWYRCYKKPEGAEISPNSTVETVPLCEAYEGTEATTDRYDDIICIDGYNYKLRCPVSEFINNGWTLNVDIEEVLMGNAYDATLTKNGSTLNITIENPTVFKVKPEQCMVSYVQATEELSGAVDISFPGGVRLGMTDAVMDKLFYDVDGFNGVAGQDILDYGEVGFSIVESTPDGGIEIGLKFIKNEDGSYRLVEYSYERNKSSLDMDPENTDYITGTMVEEN